MKKLFLLGAACCSMLMSGYADLGPANTANVDRRGQMTSYDQGQYAQGQYSAQGQAQAPSGQVIYDNACPADSACDQPMNDCYCLYVHYEPCYYCTPRCVEEQVPYQETCCRMVPQYYQVQKCRMVPEYYNETCCKQVPEYYQVEKCRTCKKWVQDQHCQYKPCYYWKHVCGNPNCTNPAPTAPACPRSR